MWLYFKIAIMYTKMPNNFYTFQRLYMLYILTSQWSVVIIVPNELLIGIPFLFDIYK